eukprot:s3693_g9.t1
MKNKAREYFNTYWKVNTCQSLQDEVVACHDIPNDILLNRGFNVSIAEEGANYNAKKARQECMRAFTEFATKMSDTQGATVAEAHRFDDWRVPLEFGDGRRPDDPSPYGHPEWVDPTEDFMTAEERQQAEAARESQSQRLQQCRGQSEHLEYQYRVLPILSELLSELEQDELLREPCPFLQRAWR